MPSSPATLRATVPPSLPAPPKPAHPPSSNQAPWKPPNPASGLEQGTGRALTDALVAGRVCLLVQLQLRLHILGGECDADLDPSGQATWVGEEGTLGLRAAPCLSSTVWLLPAWRPLAARSGLGHSVPVLSKPLGTSHGSSALHQPGTLHRHHCLAMARAGKGIDQRGGKTRQNTTPMAAVSVSFPPQRHLFPSGAPHPTGELSARGFINQMEPNSAAEGSAPLTQCWQEPICRPGRASAKAQLSSSPSGCPGLT